VDPVRFSACVNFCKSPQRLKNLKIFMWLRCMHKAPPQFISEFLAPSLVLRRVPECEQDIWAEESPQGPRRPNYLSNTFSARVDHLHHKPTSDFATWFASASARTLHWCAGAVKSASPRRYPSTSETPWVYSFTRFRLARLTVLLLTNLLHTYSCSARLTQA
jgi:hypothetical protein